MTKTRGTLIFSIFILGENSNFKLGPRMIFGHDYLLNVSPLGFILIIWFLNSLVVFHKL